MVVNQRSISVEDNSFQHILKQNVVAMDDASRLTTYRWKFPIAAAGWITRSVEPAEARAEGAAYCHALYVRAVVLTQKNANVLS